MGGFPISKGIKFQKTALIKNVLLVISVQGGERKLFNDTLD